MQIAILLGVLTLPVLLLSWLEPSLPPWVIQVAFLLVLPAAAGTAYWMSRSFGGPGELGLIRPASWPGTLAWGIGAGLGMLLVARLFINPLAVALFGQLLDPALFDPLEGQLPQLLVNVFLISWVHAALCEEIIFRGFFLRWTERLLGGGGNALVVAILVQALLFGLSHFPQGLPGIMVTTMGGILWGAIFVAAGRRLWIVIVGHATFDTVLFVLVFLGRHRLFLPE
jgi:membrane protease YdiL (CAAX protease family)